MRAVEVMEPGESHRKAGGVWLHIPDAWDCFIYRGFLYVLCDDGQFHMVEAMS